MKTVRQLAKTFRRLLFEGQNRTGPRWNIRELVRCIQLHRPLTPAARYEDEGRPALLVLVDVSGSCSGFTDDSLPVAAAAGLTGSVGAPVVVLSHSNGYPVTLYYHGHEHDDLFRSSEAPLQFYQRLFQQFNFSVVIALGDLDAAEEYLWMIHQRCVERFILIDNYCCNYYDVHPAALRKYLDDPTPATWDEIRRKVWFWESCSDVDEVITALETSCDRPPQRG